jgi:hypothetical protein
MVRTAVRRRRLLAKRAHPMTTPSGRGRKHGGRDSYQQENPREEGEIPLPGESPAPSTAGEPPAWASSALPGSGRRGVPGVPIPLHRDQNLLGIGDAAEHHDRAPPAGQQRLGRDQ